MATLPGRTRIGRVALSVADVDGVASFYGDVAGLAVHRRDRDRLALGAGDELLVLRADPDAPGRPRDAAGLFHTAFLYPSRAALAAALARARESGRMTGASDHLVSEALYLDDPAGNGVELYRDRPRAEWPTADGGVRMDTLPLDLSDLAAEREGSPSGRATDPAPPGTRIGHVHLEVTDLDRARAFYVDALGFDVTTRMRGALFVSAGGYHHHVGLNVWNRRSGPARGRGLDWFEVVVPEGLGAAVDRLRDADYAVKETEAGAVAEDSDGIEVRLVGE